MESVGKRERGKEVSAGRLEWVEKGVGSKNQGEGVQDSGETGHAVWFRDSVTEEETGVRARGNQFCPMGKRDMTSFWKRKALLKIAGCPRTSHGPYWFLLTKSEQLSDSSRQMEMLITLHSYDMHYRLIGISKLRPTNRRKEHKSLVQCVFGSSHGRGPQRPKPWAKNLAIETWNVTSLGGKEPELVREVERYRLEIVGFASMHSLGSGTQLLERGWTLFFSGVPHGERCQAGVGLLIAPQLSHHVLEFSPVNERVVSLHLRAGDRCLTVVLAYGPNGSVEYPTFLETLRGVLEGASDSDTWRGVIGRNGPPDLNSSGVLLLDFCASHSLSITNTMFKHKGAHLYM
ncbi:hypothetical protein QTP86_002185 [Hemibagrus guttatus]|nr:hypothetical protein QTP86_002185 [Hemibagrus guttatus]